MKILRAAAQEDKGQHPDDTGSYKYKVRLSGMTNMK